MTNIDSEIPTSPKILVVRFGALGDAVLITVLLRALRTTFSSATIDVATKEAFVPMLQTHPAVNDVIGLAPSGSVQSLASVITSRSYDVKIDAHGSLRSRILQHLVPGPWYTLRKHRWERFTSIWTGRNTTLVPMGERFVATVSDLGVRSDGSSPDLYVTDDDRARAREIITGDYVALAVGAQHFTKKWPDTHWRTLAHELASKGHRTVGIGLPHEATAIAESVTIGAFDLPIRVAVALVSDARAVVAHDSGMMHVATAVGVPVVALYGPTDPRLGYAPHSTHARTIGISTACRPCSVFGGARCPAGHHRCMLELTPTAVMTAVESFL